tara:strand:- start:980 stop:1858 length:879 start_codon:yes stop_codon:yes gene_type:complete
MKFIKYFFEFTIITSLFCIFKIIGLRNASNLGSILGKLIGPFFRSKNLIKKNIKIGMGNINENEEKKIINEMWSNIGRTFAEYVFLKDFKLNKSDSNHMKIIGREYLEEIKQSNKPVIFYSAHLANFELMAMELERYGIKTAAIYRPLNNIFLNPLMEYLRMKYICPNQIPKGRAGMREIINKIKNNYSIALMVDQRVGEGIKINFFNQLAQTTTIPAQLTLRYNCKLVPISLKRIKNTNFEMTVYKPYEVSKTGNDEQDTQNITLKINQIIEKMIVQNPTQWLWSHNRWKQ